MSSKIVDRDVTRINRCCRAADTSKHVRRIVRCIRRSLPWIQRKIPLRTIGICRRGRHLLYKLKTDLQNLGLSRRQVHQGLIQLVTKPRVVLTRQPRSNSRRYVWPRKLILEDEEKSSEISTHCSTNVPECNSRKKNKDTQESDTMEIGDSNEAEHSEKAVYLKSSKSLPTNNPEESSKSNISYQLGSNDTPISLHSFDKALEQLDKIVAAKVSVLEKSVSKRNSVIVSVDTTCKSQDKNNKDSPLSKKSTCNESETKRTEVENESNFVTQRTPDLVTDKVDADVALFLNNERNQKKMNLNCHKSSNEKADLAKPNVTKRLESNEEKTVTNVEADYISAKTKCSSQKSNGNKVRLEDVSGKNRTVVVTDAKVANVDENTQKKRLHEEITSDFIQRRKKISISFDEIKRTNDRKRKKIKNKFRIYFGDCRSVSEDEQERDILQDKPKRRRKKDSVDSCDSGVYTTEGSNCIEVLKDFQKAVPDSTVQEEFSENASEISIEVGVSGKEKTVIKNECMKTINQVEDIESITKVNKIKSLETVTKVDKVKNSENITKVKRVKNIEVISKVENFENFIESENTENTQSIFEIGSTENINKTNETQSSICEMDNDKVTTKDVIQEKLVNNCDRNNLVDTITEISVMQIFQTTEKSVASVPIIDEETGTDTNTFCGTLNTCNADSNGQVNTIEVSVRSEENNLDSTELRKLLQMPLKETYQITSNGNVISIQENTKGNPEQNNSNQDSDENLNLEIQSNNNQSIERVSNDIGGNNRVHSKDTGKDTEAVSLNKVCDASDNINKSILQESELSSITDKEDSQQNKVPQARLRVLSSAELGSRWCPTPVNTCKTRVNPQFLYIDKGLDGSLKTITTASILSTPTTQTIHETTHIIPVPVAEMTQGATILPSNIEVTNPALLKIQNLIAYARTSSLPYTLDIDNLLAREFINLHETCNQSYVNVINSVINVLNATKFVAQPLSGRELFKYSSSLKFKYSIELSGYKKDKKVLNQNTHQYFQNACTTSVQTTTQKIPPVSSIQNSCSMNLNQASVSTGSTQVQQNFRENVILQQQNNLTQSSKSTNSTTNLSLNTQQIKYRMETQRPSSQQKVSEVYNSNRPVSTNIYTSSEVPVESAFHSSIGINQPRRKIYIPNTLASWTNQQYVPHNVYVTQANTCYTANTCMKNYQMQQNINSVQMNQQQNVNSTQMKQQQNINSTQLKQQQNVNSTQLKQQQNINSTQLKQQQNINSTQLQQQQNINPAQMKQQQNINPTHAVQQQNVNPTYVDQLRNVNLARATQQSIYLTQRFQQQHVNSVRAVQQQNIHLAQRIQQQNINSTYGTQQQNNNISQEIQQQNINLIQNIQQQNNLIYMPQQQIIPSARGMQQQNISSVSQLSQNIQQTELAMNYKSQSVQNVYTTSAPQIVPPAMQQKELIYQKMLPRRKMKQTMPPPPPYSQAVHSSKAEQSISLEKKKENTAQISLESTMKQFSVLKYLSDIQKLMLREHMEFYFNYTAWLEQEFTMEEWNEINKERLLLLNFQTRLKHLVEKTLKDLQKKCQENTTEKNLFVDIKIGAPKKLHIIVEENDGVPYQVQVSKADQSQCETMNLNQCNAFCQKNLNAVQNQFEKQQKATDDLDNTQSLFETRELEILHEKEQNNNELQKDKQDEDAALQIKDQSIVTSTVEIEASKNSENREDIETNVESCAMSCNMSPQKQTLLESEKTVEDIIHTTEKVVVASDLKDTIQSQNAHLVTVEISPNNDHVTVIDINPICKTRDTVIKMGTEKPKDDEQKEAKQEEIQEEEPHSTYTLPSLEEAVNCEISTEPTPESPDDDIKYTNYAANIDDTMTEENFVSYIADVRSISLEAFEKIGEGNNVPTNIIEGNIEEEEIKICLCCSKPSNVVCSICLEAKYCSKKCAEMHWREHYKNCEPVKKNVYI